MASFSLMCFAKSFATILSLLRNARKVLRVHLVRFEINCRKQTCRAISAARIAEEATTKVCGDPFLSKVEESCVESEEYWSRNSGRFFKNLGLVHLLVSCMAFSMINVQ